MLREFIPGNKNCKHELKFYKMSETAVNSYKIMDYKCIHCPHVKREYTNA